MIMPFDNFLNNVEEAVQLLTLYREKNAGKKSHHAYEVLVKSCIVHLVACWEAFVEDCAEVAVDFLVDNTERPNKLPKALLQFISSELKNDKNDLKVWDLAGDGWKKVVKDNYKSMLAKHLGPFNTPRAGNIDILFKAVLAIDNLSSNWCWKGMSNKNAKDKLNDAISLRGEIAHRVQASKKVSRTVADGFGPHFIFLAIKTSNEVRSHIYQVTGKYPWAEETYRSIR